MSQNNNNKLLTRGLSLFLLIFGIMTIVSGGRVIFVDAVRLAAGNIFLIIVWFNFLAGFLYLVSAWGLWESKPCVKKVALFLFVAHLIVMSYLGVQILTGEKYEMRTLAAIIFRTLVWAGVLLATRSRAKIITLAS